MHEHEWSSAPMYVADCDFVVDADCRKMLSSLSRAYATKCHFCTVISWEENVQNSNLLICILHSMPCTDRWWWSQQRGVQWNLHLPTHAELLWHMQGDAKHAVYQLLLLQHSLRQTLKENTSCATKNVFGFSPTKIHSITRKDFAKRFIYEDVCKLYEDVAFEGF